MKSHEQLRAEFTWVVPEYFNFATDVFDKWARDASRIAMLWKGEGEEQTITFAELTVRSSRLANALTRLGLKRGDRVLLVLPRIVEWWESMLGLTRAGVVPVPGTSQLTPKDLLYRVRAAECRAVITDEQNAAKFEDSEFDGAGLTCRICVSRSFRPGWESYSALRDRAPAAQSPVRTRSGEPALAYFTSGTTAHPKIVLHTHASCGIGHRVTGEYWLNLSPDDLHWNLSDTGWAKAGYSSFFGPWRCGATIFVQHSEGRFSPRDILEYLARYPITTLCAAPTILRMLVQEDLRSVRFSKLRHTVAAGEPLNPEVISLWRNGTGQTIRDGYGQTETVLICGNTPGLEVRPGSMGKPMPGFDLAVVDEEGNPSPPHREGEIAVRTGPVRPVGLFREYWRDPQATAKSFRNGWYFTGDRAFVDEQGYFWFIGRGDDVILSSAYRISPFEVESVLLEHSAVAEAAVVASPDQLRGSIVKAFVVLSRGHTPSTALVSELQEFVKRTTAPYKYPREIEFVGELPKTVSGKIRRAELREQEQQRKRQDSG